MLTWSEYSRNLTCNFNDLNPNTSLYFSEIYCNCLKLRGRKKSILKKAIANPSLTLLPVFASFPTRQIGGGVLICIEQAVYPQRCLRHSQLVRESGADVAGGWGYGMFCSDCVWHTVLRWKAVSSNSSIKSADAEIPESTRKPSIGLFPPLPPGDLQVCRICVFLQQRLVFL